MSGRGTGMLTFGIGVTDLRPLAALVAAFLARPAARAFSCCCVAWL